MKPVLQGNSESLNAETPASDAPAFEWRVHPLRERPGVAALVIAFLFLLHGAIYWFLGHWWYVGVAAAVLLPSLAPFFLPVEYTLHPRYIAVRTPFRRFAKSWEAFQRCEIGPKGLFLSPFPTPSRLDNFRGLYVRFGRHREEVLRAFRMIQEGGLPC